MGGLEKGNYCGILFCLKRTVALKDAVHQLAEVLPGDTRGQRLRVLVEAQKAKELAMDAIF